MSGLFFDACWLVGGILGAMVLHRGFHEGWFTVKKQPPAVRVDAELIAQLRSQVVHDAMKRKVIRPDFNRNFNLHATTASGPLTVAKDRPAGRREGAQ